MEDIKYCSPSTCHFKIKSQELSINIKFMEESVEVPNSLRHILKLLKLMGCIIFSEDQRGNKQQILRGNQNGFHFKLRSWDTVISVVMQFCYLLVCYRITINS